MKNCWLIKKPVPSDTIQEDSSPAPLIVFSHGNAGSLTIFIIFKGIGSITPDIQFHAETAVLLASSLNCNVLVYDYSGFGRSQPGFLPTHSQLRTDMRAVMKYVISLQQKATVGSIWLYGHSIGGAVTIDYLVHAPRREQQCVSLCILDNTIYSLHSVATSVLPENAKWLVPFIVANVWRNFTLIKRIKKDTIFIVGEKDELVPSSHSRYLYQICGLMFPLNSRIFFLYVIFIRSTT